LLLGQGRQKKVKSMHRHCYHSVQCMGNYFLEAQEAKARWWSVDIWRPVVHGYNNSLVYSAHYCSDVNLKIIVVKLPKEYNVEFEIQWKGTHTYTHTNVCGHPFKWVDSAISATPVANRCIKSSTQPCNLHRQTVAVE
jgi:hypothetical protein